MNQCCWCHKIQNIHTGEWQNGAAEILQEASRSICPECEKKIREEYKRNGGKVESGK